MFNYVFPIFCFGLVMAGIVFLGIIEAAKQVKAESVKGREPATRDNLPNTVSSPNGQRIGQLSRFTARSINE